MSASAGFQNEQNFMAQWMSNTSRAGVILNPPVDFGNPIKSTWAEQDGNDSFSAQFAPLSSSNSSCISVDSLHGEVVSLAKTNAELDPSSFDISSAITAFQSTALHHVQETEEDGIHEEDSMEHHFQDGGRPNQQCTGPLMQKLEQVTISEVHRRFKCNLSYFSSNGLFTRFSSIQVSLHILVLVYLNLSKHK